MFSKIAKAPALTRKLNRKARPVLLRAEFRGREADRALEGAAEVWRVAESGHRRDRIDRFAPDL